MENDTTVTHYAALDWKQGKCVTQDITVTVSDTLDQPRKLHARDLPDAMRDSRTDSPKENEQVFITDKDIHCEP